MDWDLSSLLSSSFLLPFPMGSCGRTEKSNVGSFGKFSKIRSTNMIDKKNRKVDLVTGGYREIKRSLSRLFIMRFNLY